jgi:hypothetical protein
MRPESKKVFVPSEFCVIDGVPASIRSNGRNMRNLLNTVKQNPSQKMDAIETIIAKLFNSS